MEKSSLDKIEKRLVRLRRGVLRDFAKFRRFYFPHYHKAEDAPFHREIVGLLAGMTTSRNGKLALAAPRGSAKSTIITLEYVIYSVCYRTEPFIVVISSNAENAADYLSNIKRELESNARLRKDFPEVCEIDRKPQPSRWSRHDIVTKNDVKVTALSVGQNIRGKRHNENRPSLIILDDMEGNDVVQSSDSQFKLKDWFEKSVLKAGYNATNLIFAGTIHNYRSLLAQYTNPSEAPGWRSFIFRSIIAWSDADTEWNRWANIFRSNEDFNGATGPESARQYFEANQEKMLAGTEVLWPQNKSYYDLMVMREQEGSVSFDSEMQNEPVNPRDCFFDVNDFHFWDDEFASEELLLRSMRHPVFFAACDPSTGKDRSRGDYSAFLIGVRDTGGKILYLLDVDMERRQPEELVRTIIGYLTARKVSRFAFESNNFQELLVDMTERRAREAGISTAFRPVENRGNKIARIQTLEPFLKTGQIRFRRKHRALVDQLKYFPKGQHDDGPDALEMLYQVAANHTDFVAVANGLAKLVNQLHPPGW